MWLSKDERKVLRYLYKILRRDAIDGTVKLNLEEFARCCFDEGRAVETARFLAARGLLKLGDIIHPSNYIMLGFTPDGYDLGRKYSSTLGTAWVWCDEHKFWVILAVIISLIGVLVAIFKD